MCVSVMHPNWVQSYNKYLKYTRIWLGNANLFVFFSGKSLLFAQLCDCNFGGMYCRRSPKLHQIFDFFDICKFFCYLQGNTGIKTNISRTLTKNPPISSHFLRSLILLNILLTEGKETATWSRS